MSAIEGDSGGEGRIRMRRWWWRRGEQLRGGRRGGVGWMAEQGQMGRREEGREEGKSSVLTPP